MTQGSQFSAPPHSSDQGKADVAKQHSHELAEHAQHEATGVAQDAKEEGRHLADTAKQEASQVADTAATQARKLMDQATSELNEHAGSQQQRLAGSIRTLADELGAMVRSSDQSGTATDLADQAAGKASQLADWLESHGPGDVVTEVRRFAARRPGAFLALAAGAGLLAGRLTRGLTADDSSSSAADQDFAGRGSLPAAKPGPTHPVGAVSRGQDYREQVVPGDAFDESLALGQDYPGTRDVGSGQAGATDRLPLDERGAR